MTAFPPDLARRWSDRLRETGFGVSAQVERWLADALTGRSPDELPLPTAGALVRYLHGMSIGIAGTVGGWPAPPAGMCLTAGLLAGAAALEPVDPTLAAAARSAGLVAADRAVEDGDAVLVVDTAVRATAQEPIRSVLTALSLAVRPSLPPPEPASCGAGPHDLAGVPFAAEITFLSSAVAADLDDLRQRLVPLVDEAHFWPEFGETRVHLHTREPGPCIAQAYAAGAVFDLRVAACP